MSLIMLFAAVTIVYVLACMKPVSPKYLPKWKSLDSRPLPLWYDRAKFGIFIHWGIYSVPMIGSEWFWKIYEDKYPPVVQFMKKNYPPKFTYRNFSRTFKAYFFDPVEWAAILQESGAKYVVLTAKHHDGFALWPSQHSSGWNSIDVGPHTDLVGEIEAAVRSMTDLRFGIYHSLLEWFHPLYLKDKAANFTTDAFVREKVMPELLDLVNTYEPDIVWSDGDWENTETYWRSKEFLAWLYNASPVKDFVVVNDRWGISTRCVHGDFFNCEDNYDARVLKRHKWERCVAMDKESWGYRGNAKLEDYLTTREILEMLVETVSLNGNLLLNIGPNKDGIIPIIMQERLANVGAWLRINGEGIYGTQPWSTQREPRARRVWYTTKRNSSVVYAFIFDWPPNGTMTLRVPRLSPHSVVQMLGHDAVLQWRATEQGVEIELPNNTTVPWYIWCLKLNNIKLSLKS